MILGRVGLKDDLPFAFGACLGIKDGDVTVVSNVLSCTKSDDQGSGKRGEVYLEREEPEDLVAGSDVLRDRKGGRELSVKMDDSTD